MAIVEISQFSKNFGEKRVIRDLSFSVEPGEIFAFLGANGSGKTTTIRCLLGLYPADAGTLLIGGKPFGPERTKELGYLPEERGLYLESRVLETLVFMGQLKGLSSREAKARAMQYLERVELADKAQVNIKKLSSGQQQKIQLGLTVLHRPSLLILDEPTKGLDPVNRQLLLDLLEELRTEGTTIIFSTHHMEEAEAIADRLVMIKAGERVLYGSVEQVKEPFQTGRLLVRYTGAWQNSPTLFSASVAEGRAEITPAAGVSFPQILRFLLDSGVTVLEFTQPSPSLQEIFVQVEKGQHV